MPLIDRLRRRRDDTAVDLYAAIVARARAPHWYLEGGVPDSQDGRFDAIATILSVVLLRLERDAGGRALAARLTERFVADMDSQLRQIGIGDLVVGKHVGRMMGLLGGRLGALRDGLATGDVTPAVTRNLYRAAAPAAAVAHSAGAIADFASALDATDLSAIAAGRIG